MTIIKGILIGALLLGCVIGSGLEETSKVQTDDATSVGATMAQMGVTQ